MVHLGQYYFIALIAMSAAPVVSADDEPLVNLMGQIWENTLSELVLFTDEGHSKSTLAVAKRLQEKAIPLYLFGLEFLLKPNESQKMECPIITAYQDVKASPLELSLAKTSKPLPLTQRSKSIFFLSEKEDMRKGLEVINKTVRLCPQSNDLGIFGDTSHLFFLASDVGQMDEIESHFLLRHHPWLSFIMEKSPRSLMFCALPCNSDIIINNLGFLTNLDKTTDLKEVIPPMFCRPLQFFGKQIHGLDMPRGIFPPGEELPRDVQTPLSMFIHTLERPLNFTASLYYPSGGIQSFTEEGKLMGLFGYVLRFETDIAMGAFSQSFESQQVASLSSTLGPQIYLSFVTNKPSPIPKYLALIRPFSFWLWLFFFVSLPVVSLAAVLLAKSEEEMQELILIPFSRPFEATWFFIGTLCGESVGKEETYQHSNVLRSVVLTWLLFCFVMTAAYSGVLFSFLSNPGYEKPIDTVKDILEHDINVIWPLYGFAAFSGVSESDPDKDLYALWKRAEAPYIFSRPLYEWVAEISENKGAVVMVNKDIEYALIFFTLPNGETSFHFPSPVLRGITTYYSLGFPKLSKFGNLLKISLDHFLSHALLDILYIRSNEMERRQWIEGGGAFTVTLQRDSYAPFLINDLQGPFYFLLIFTGISLLLWLLEFFIGRKKKSLREMAKMNKEWREGIVAEDALPPPM